MAGARGHARLLMPLALRERLFVPRLLGRLHLRRRLAASLRTRASGRRRVLGLRLWLRLLFSRDLRRRRFVLLRRGHDAFVLGSRGRRRLFRLGGLRLLYGSALGFRLRRGPFAALLRHSMDGTSPL